MTGKEATNCDAGDSGTQTIIHCVRSTIGGIFRHISDVIIHQHKRGHRVGLICDSLTGGSFERTQLEALKPYLRLGVSTLPMPRAPSPSDAMVVRAIYKALQPLDVDVIHCHGAKGGAYGRLVAGLLSLERKRRGRPGVVAIYAPHGGSLHYDRSSFQGKCYFKLERMLERLTDEFLFVAGFEVEAYTKKIGKPFRPWSIAYNGLREEELTPVSPDTNAVDFVYAGHMRDLKGTDLFIDAVEIANARSAKPIHTIMFGDGDDRARYEKDVMARRLTPFITFRNPTDIREVFRSGRTLVVPSRGEAMPYIVLEAIGANVPLISTNVGGIPEIFGPFSKHLLEPGDANLIATEMLNVLAYPNQIAKRTEHLRDFIGEKFTVNRMCETIDSVYARHLAAMRVGQRVPVADIDSLDTAIREPRA